MLYVLQHPKQRSISTYRWTVSLWASFFLWFSTCPFFAGYTCIWNEHYLLLVISASPHIFVYTTEASLSYSTAVPFWTHLWVKRSSESGKSNLLLLPKQSHFPQNVWNCSPKNSMETNAFQNAKSPESGTSAIFHCSVITKITTKGETCCPMVPISKASTADTGFFYPRTTTDQRSRALKWLYSNPCSSVAW